MKIFENLLIRSKLLISFGLVWIMFLATIIVAYLNINNNNKSEKTLNDIYFQSALIAKDIQSLQNHNRAEILNLMLVNDKGEQAKIKANIAQNSDSINGMISQLSELKSDAFQENLIKDLKDVLDVYRDGREEEIGLIENGKIDEARQLGAGIQAERFEKIEALLQSISDKGLKDTSVQLAADLKQARTSTAIFITLGIVALVLSTLIILSMNKLVAIPLNRISDMASNIALGDLSMELTDNNRKDEIGQLTNSFKTMQTSLIEKAESARQISEGNLDIEITPLSEKDMMGYSFQTMVKKLRSQLQDISDGINVLASSSAEIMASVSQLASSSAETATAVGETSSTVEEVKQTATVSNDKAQTVSENAMKMTKISGEGNKAVSNTIEGMSKIKNQMNAIANMVVKLSEQSQTIGEITSTVTELAEQSNLLAVNAAIEAAKAGEQGKGFSVVAQEIKLLANRSKEATAQVKTILRDVQKSISSAVMATEEGSKAVDEGLKLTNISGDTIRTLSDSVTEASNTAIQIATSSQQQLEGMSQIAAAMESISEASKQSVTSTKQSVESVNELQKVGQKLNTLIKHYKLSTNGKS